MATNTTKIYSMLVPGTTNPYIIKAENVEGLENYQGVLIEQEKGYNTESVMSQNAVTVEFDNIDIEIAQSFNKVIFDNENKSLNFYHDDVKRQSVDISAIIISGVLIGVEFDQDTNEFVFTFATEDSQQEIRVPASAIFDQTLYYTKVDIHNLIGDVSGFLYKGVAVPETVPVPITSDSKLFYIALKTGEYINFKESLYVKSLTVIKSVDGIWKAEEIGIPEGGSSTDVVLEFGDSETSVISQKVITRSLYQNYQYRGIITSTKFLIGTGKMFWIVAKSGLILELNGNSVKPEEYSILTYDSDTSEYRLTPLGIPFFQIVDELGYDTKKVINQAFLTHKFISLENSLGEFFDDVQYNELRQYLEFYNNGILKAAIDCSKFIVSGLIRRVYIDTENGELVIEFNMADNSVRSVRLKLSEIFLPENYYQKFEIDNLIDSIIPKFYGIIEDLVPVINDTYVEGKAAGDVQTTVLVVFLNHPSNKTFALRVVTPDSGVKYYKYWDNANLYMSGILPKSRIFEEALTNNTYFYDSVNRKLSLIEAGGSGGGFTEVVNLLGDSETTPIGQQITSYWINKLKDKVFPIEVQFEAAVENVSSGSGTVYEYDNNDLSVSFNWTVSNELETKDYKESILTAFNPDGSSNIVTTNKSDVGKGNATSSLISKGVTRYELKLKVDEQVIVKSKSFSRVLPLYIGIYNLTSNNEEISWPSLNGMIRLLNKKLPSNSINITVLASGNGNEYFIIAVPEDKRIKVTSGGYNVMDSEDIDPHEDTSIIIRNNNLKYNLYAIGVLLEGEHEYNIQVS